MLYDPSISPSLFISIISLYRSASVDSPFFHMSSLVSRDGITPKSGGARMFPGEKGGVWTLNLLDGKLFLFKTSPNSEQPVEVDKEDETELMEGIELAKLLSRMTSPGTPVCPSPLPPLFSLPLSL